MKNTNNYNYVEKRKSVLTNHDIQAIYKIMNENIPIDIHNNHHKWIDTKISKEDRYMQLKEKVTQQAVGWGVISLIGTMGYLIGIGLIKYIKQLIN